VKPGPSLLASLLLSSCLGEFTIADDSASESSDDAEASECSPDDVEHCGACGVVCLPGQTCNNGECESEFECNCDEARELCVDGACECRQGLSACGGACVDLRSDVAHCGGCDQPCAGACVDGECAADCESPKTLCGSACVDLSSDFLHCEECGNICQADEICVFGNCRDYSLAGCTSCPCECGESTCCESSSLDAVLCVHDETCPP
jgi:hypothetical protein